MDKAHAVTEILHEWRNGDKDAPDRLFPIVYEELRRRAAKYLSGERSDHTLQPTALVHEAYLRMIGQTSLSADNRLHFYRIASRVMRQVLVDHARTHNAEKRGGAATRLSLDSVDVGTDVALGDVLHLDDALERLGRLDQRKLSVVEMRFFGGLSEDEIAKTLELNERTVRRDWEFARAWLYRELANV